MEIPRQTITDAAISKQQKIPKLRYLWHGIKPGLRFRLLFMVLGVALVSLLVSIYSLFSYQRDQLIANTHTATTALSKVVEANLLNAMRSDDWRTVNNIIQTAKRENAVESLRIIGLRGRVVATSKANELGQHFDREDQLCQQCHAAGDQTPYKLSVLDVTNGEQLMLSMNLIRNGPECWACHSVEQKVLGLLVIETPLTMMNHQLIDEFWRATIIALIACGLLVGLLVPTLNRYVLRPIEALSKGVSELSAGNLDYQVKGTNGDELGMLAESFDRMRQQLKHSYTEIRRREKEAATLYELGTEISASLAQTQLLDSTADAARKLLNAEVGLVGLYNEASEEIIIKAAAGSRAEAHKGMRMPVCPDTPGGVLHEGVPVIAEAYDQNNLIHTDDNIPAEERTVSILAVPLKLGDKFLGMIEVMSQERKKFTQADALLLVRLAQQVVVSIENAQLYQQLRNLATLEERDRLAREMHDHLAQLLGYLNVRASMTDELLSGGRLDDARESLAELKRTAKIAYTDVREEIFNLRTAVSPRVGLLPTLKKYLSEYHSHYGLETRLSFDDESLTQFPSEIASQLLRIIQEALTNVRKHSCATQAWVRFVQDRDLVNIQIEDNGTGFDLDQPTEAWQQSYGLQIMRERAESVGGIFRLDSKPGQGTRVTVRLPIFSEG